VIEPRSFTAEQWQRFFQEARLALGVNETGSEHVTFATEFDMQGAQKLGWYVRASSNMDLVHVEKSLTWRPVRFRSFTCFLGGHV